jgi:iron-sulfur cluster repair protein YtfE (RIC family)
MSLIDDFMTRHHRQCDEALARAEEAAAASDWTGLDREAGTFFAEMARHLGIEEQLLFPVFENKTGMTSGPTEVMRMEHDQMRGLLEQMRLAVQAKDTERYLGLSETLQVLLQQHNIKEEGVLYPMIDRALRDDADGLMTRIGSFAV